ncbi:phage holin, LLH family [Limosilactobacillus fermentum]|uniref:phage holin, LLH family n=1 Tax=Limosilactobacillus fermentum TaxID=1613 RepID=UPI002F266554
MNTVNDILEWLIQSGILAVLVAFLWAYAKPLLTAKAKTAKTEQSRQLWTLAEQVAEAAVNTMASRNMSGADKYAKAVDMVQATLAKYGHHIAPEDAGAVVQSAYEKSGLDDKQKSTDDVNNTQPVLNK